MSQVQLDIRLPGVVVIGRNEGERLLRCLRSLSALAAQTVYVDSGSTDGSVALARSFEIEVVELDLSKPFTAARARNDGFRRLLEIHPGLSFVFFVDGDCQVVEGWPAKAVRFLSVRPDVAVVFGRRRELYPERSIYNMLCDLEWEDASPGETRFCGGDACMRVSALQQVQGYRSDLICGEEPELCVRLRRAGWRVWHVSEPMTVHDAALHHFSQWWIRMLRGGYAFALGASIHGAPPERHWVKECQRAWLWGLVIPTTILALGFIFSWWMLCLLLVYPAHVVYLATRMGRKHISHKNWLRAFALVLCKFPEMLGQLKFAFHRYGRVHPHLIEYK